MSTTGTNGQPATPLAIEVQDVSKTFRIPDQRYSTFKERAVHPLSRPSYREIVPLRDVSFEVAQGEFFGIVGRNGSGKSTLLKILAGIYRADAGRIRMAGRQAPFIELGVGFNMEFTAHDNIVLNAVMMGLSRREARTRVGAVLDFAELNDFADLKLKNYSSGMVVRLAFATMLQADADILLIDEVLAVGDAAFAQKCADVFHDLRDGPKTVVLVTHDMGSVEKYCDRAMLIDEGDVRHIGDPEEVAQRYLRANFQKAGEQPEQDFAAQTGDEDARLVRAWLEDGAGLVSDRFGERQPLNLRIEVEAVRDITWPSFGWNVTNEDGVIICGFGTHLSVDGRIGELLAAGNRARLASTIENPLVPGRYYVNFWACRNRAFTDVVVRIPKALTFVVYGSPEPAPGVVSVPGTFVALPEEDAEPSDDQAGERDTGEVPR